MDLNSAGALLYWCEGSKRERDRRVEFVNSDPQMTSIFLRYLRSMRIEEDRIRIRMMIHLQDDEDACREHWKGITGLQDLSFMRSVVKRTGPLKKPLPQGAVTVGYNSLELLRRVKLDILTAARRLSCRCPRMPHQSL
ncbi:MAG: hypothetical protein JRN06_12705 [Nitrososphaerota archaeon]|nr:hypothetical protein [Nitrososphaerota archaeon]MDG7024656.1 hypothetical protein [Nitrososphaerota archaeon]